MATIYASERLYLESAATLQDLITRLRQVRDCYLTQMAKAAVKGDIAEYTLNDGQTIIRVKQRGIDEMADAMHKIERTLQTYANQFNGRVMVAKDFNDVQYLTDTLGI